MAGMSQSDSFRFVVGLWGAATMVTVAAPLATQQEQSALVRTVVAAQPSELGEISWWRDEAAAQAAASASGKPVLVLFQEVPG
jgi:hypothetical protein